MDRKLFCVSLLGKQKVKATAVFKDEQLVIAKLEPITGVLGTWRYQLLREIKKKHDDGFTVVIEERGDTFSEYALKLLLEDADPTERRPNMSIAFDHYFYFDKLGSLIYQKDIKRHQIAESHVNIVTDDRGRAHYDVNKESFSGYHRAILLCTLAAVHVTPCAEDYLDEFIRCLGFDHDNDEMFSTFKSLEKRAAHG